MSQSGPPKSSSAIPPDPHHAVRFVGREAERAVLHDALEAALAGHGNLVLFTGEPGIGKTRICEEFELEARARKVPVAWGKCWGGGGARPYWPWMEVLRFCARAQSAAELRAAAGEAAGLVAALVPELARPGDVDVRRQLPLNERDEQSDQFALFLGVTDILRAFATRTPLVVVIDDLHAADADSALLTQFVARNLRTIPMLLLVTYRDTHGGQASRLADCIAELSREGRNLALQPFNRVQIGKFLELMGHPANDGVVEEL